jgi:hypothetical protein
MERKNILIIGMLDSIHLARWLKQFENEQVNFTLFPSKKFKKINGELIKLIKSNKLANFYLKWPWKLYFIPGYIDYFMNLLGNIFGINFRKNALKAILLNNSFDFVHALEIQGAGYLYSEMSKNCIDKNNLILTNWGSDIYFFRKEPSHDIKIQKALQIAKYYSAECERDYDLLKFYNFSGVKLPCIPNAGGFSLQEINSEKKPASERLLILCKGYGGVFGQVQIALPAIERVLEIREDISVFFYSVTPDVEPAINRLVKKFQGRVNYSKVSKPLNRLMMLKLFDEALVYIGCSKSDAISTSFLEALVHGAYPIQTNTSCANEWINKGVKASLIDLNSLEVFEVLTSVLRDSDLLSSSQKINQEFVIEHLSYDKIKVKALSFYNIDAKTE